MTNIVEIHTTYNDIISNLDKYIDIFLRDGLLAFRRLNASEQEQRTILANFGEKLGWLPNKKYPKSHKYVENHSNALTVYADKGKEDLVVLWHLEHCSVKHPQCAAAWNMIKFNCDPSSGTTGFIDSSKIYNDMPDEWKIFLDKCIIRDHMQGALAEDFEETGTFKSLDGYTYSSHQRPAVMIHPNTGIKICRINPIHVETRIISFDGRPATDSEIDYFSNISNFYRNEVWNNPDRAMWWEWNQGDLIIPDLNLMVHAVRGGFDYDQREFIGYWAYRQEAVESFPELHDSPWQDDYIL